jgi:phospho-N-acetylmuramoyl-pentapeptide-transferase
MPIFIQRLKQLQFGQYIREDGPQQHQQKAGTPTAGGIITLMCSIAGLVFSGIYKPFNALLTPEVFWVAFVLLVFGVLGFSDDWLKIAKRKNKGLSGYTKLAIQVVLGLAFGAWLYLTQTHGEVKFFSLATLTLGWFYPVYAAFVITACSNAVNLTDGLDGLAAGTLFVTFLALSIHLYGWVMPLSVMAAILASAIAGFWWFNRHPAQIFMGDTGSLALGGALGVITLASQTEWALILIAPVFILEALSVILQVGSFKLTGRRLFKMAPLHHHFELCGFTEQQVVWGFITIQAVSAALCLVMFFRF